ncbi:MBL fold metallo-hydrolase [Pseudoalteromonas xiamenensis]
MEQIVRCLLVLTLISPPVFAEKVVWRIETITPHLHVLFGRGGNIAVHVGDEGVYIVDDQFAALSEDIKRQINTIQSGLPEFVINTHFHGDHTGGNAPFATDGSHIIAHHHVRERLESAHGAGSNVLPRLTFGSDLTLHFNNEHAVIQHFEHAHTDGDAVVFFTVANAVHMGDLYFNTGSLPYVDVDSGGSVDGLLAALYTVHQRIGPSTTLIPGHGALGKKVDLEQYIALIERAKKRVLNAIATHKSESAVIEADPLDGLGLEYSSWLPKARVTRLFYRSLCNEACFK